MMRIRRTWARGHSLSEVVAAFAPCLALLSTPALAHHASAGATPSNGWEGLLSGLAHPVLGVDHLAFIVAAGLLAALHRHGSVIPISFVTASLAGTSLHVLEFNLPAPEFLIPLSVILMGSLLVTRPLSLVLLISLASSAGIIHGYAYGESVVGAEMSSLATYLIGLAVIQLAISLSTERVFRVAVRRTPETGGVTLRWAAVVTCTVGLAYVGMQWIR